MSFVVHGATVEVTASSLTINRSRLATSLGASAHETIPLSSIDASSVQVQEPTATAFGAVRLRHSHGSANAEPLVIRCAPHQDATRLAGAIRAALRGEAPEAQPIAGLNFTAVDVETANDNWGSVCQIGAVRFRDGEEAESRTWLCTPPPGLEHFEDVNISIHGITAEDVAGAQPFAEAAAELFDFLGEDVLVAHNAQFDSTALRTGLLRAKAPIPTVELACSLALARDASAARVITVDNHKLPTVAAYVGAERFRHHDATEDARAAGVIVCRLAQLFGHSGSIEELFRARKFTLGIMNAESIIPVLREHTAPTSAEDLGAGTDFRSKTRRAGSAAGAKNTGAGSGTGASQASNAASDGGGKQRTPAPWQSVATPDTIPDPNPDADPEGALFGQNVTLTGEFAPFDKGLLWRGIAERGGQVGKNVTKKTTILVIGEWATTTSKEKRAKQLNEKGQGIEMWPAEKLLEELQLSEEPPF
ncbi:exonuclease domain-containing protein [Corynebacterium sp.]|uniref:exonuclease domain-containing protein n=1 Tax=Corynebacterium sp. TaxID=1720 RepID=UPI0026DC8651|nr:exonuclease domain-containing protein [Corynebacterium sp.]MDO5031422.1 exonuclease domain-containing protein [Corynebacterium sp.]